MGPRASDQGEMGKNEPVGRESLSADATADPVAQPSLLALLSVRRLKLSPATNHALERFGYTTIGQIIDLSDAELLQNPYLTPPGVAEIRSALRQFAQQPNTPNVLATSPSQQTATEESVPQPVFPYTDWSQSAAAPTASPLAAIPLGRTSQPATRSFSRNPYTVRELGLSDATTRALEHFGQWRVKELSNEALSQNPYITASGVAEVRQALHRLAEQTPLPDTLMEVANQLPRMPEPASDPLPTESASRRVFPYTDWSQSAACTDSLVRRLQKHLVAR